MRPNQVDRVKGVHDWMPNDAIKGHYLRERWLEFFTSWGYRQIELPILEHAELYLRKSGSELLSKTYTFTYQNRRLALRPEMTASVIRAFVEHMQSDPMPVRVAYTGPVFRYERPQESRFRQFTEVGIELIGASGPMADAEVLALACKGLEIIGILDYHISIGHIGLLQQLLRALDLNERAQDFILGSLELLDREGKDSLQNRFDSWYPALDPNVAKANDLSNFSAGDISSLLDLINPDLRGRRTREEIVNGLVAKMQRADIGERIQRALKFIDELVTLHGEPYSVLNDTKMLLQRWNLDTAVLSEIEKTINFLYHYGIDSNRIEIDLGLSRGLRYYNGLIFEMYHTRGDISRQICGGGRYNELARALGASGDTPACGFAYGLERIQSALEGNDKFIPPALETPQVFVIPVSESDQSYAIDIAKDLRSCGFRVELAIRERGVKGHMRYAERIRIPYVIIVGEDERLNNMVVVRAMKYQEEKRVNQQEICNLLGDEEWKH